MSNIFAPIALFTYRRIPHETIKSLQQNILSKQSELFIFSDGYKNDIDKKDVLAVREYLKTIDGFDNITIYEAEKNKGLANSIISGVTKIIDKYGKVIVLEDDLVVSEDFLDYMNKALEFYRVDESIWSISAYGPPLSCLKTYKKDIYLSVRGSSWGWATWKDRWQSIDWDVRDWKEFKQDTPLQQQFDLGGNDMYKMLELQMLGKIDSWAIRWCYTQFRLKKHTVYPKYSKVLNEGFNDNKGTHNSGVNDKLASSLYHKKIKFEKLTLEENIVQCFQKFHNLKLKTKIGYALKKYGGYALGKKVLKFIKG